MRHRKIAILTPQGFQKLQATLSNTAIWNQHTQSCTLEALSEATGISTHTLSKVHARQSGVDFRTLIRYFSAFDLTLESSDYLRPLRQAQSSEVMPAGLPVMGLKEACAFSKTVSWGMAPDVSEFYGRSQELLTLKQWILEQRCRCISILGMGGIGKTWLATKLTEDIHEQFQSVVWRSLRPMHRSNTPIPLSSFLDDLLEHLDSGVPPVPLATPISLKIQQLINILRCKPCLLVLDNVESILSNHQGSTQQQCAIEADDSEQLAYSELLRQLVQGRHQSCIILTSRMEPQPIRFLVGSTLGVHNLYLQGLRIADIQQILLSRASLQGSPQDWHDLVHYYGGNPLILSIVAETIQPWFNGSIVDFLRHDTMICEDIRALLEQQVDVLSAPAQALIQLLATHSTPVPLPDLRSQTPLSTSTGVLLEALKALKARSLICRTTVNPCLQPWLKDYVSTHFALSSS